MRYRIIGITAALLMLFFVSVRIIGGRGMEPFDFHQYGTLIESTASDRFVPLDGSLNTRDVGGYETKSGQIVKTGIFYRSGHFNRLTDGDLEKLKTLDVRTVVDLREPDRAEAYPNRLPGTAMLVSMPLYDATKPLHFHLLFNRRGISEQFASYYIEYLEVWGHRMKGIFEFLADEQKSPMIIHCSNGKDRVGVVTALLLDLLGVPRDVIIDDFLLSNLHLEQVIDAFIAHEEGRLLTMLGIPRDDLRILMGVDPDWIIGALDYVDQAYGSAENYLMKRVGLDAETLEAVRNRML